jgi:hypothetical protein
MSKIINGNGGGEAEIQCRNDGELASKLSGVASAAAASIINKALRAGSAAQKHQKPQHLLRFAWYDRRRQRSQSSNVSNQYHHQ